MKKFLLLTIGVLYCLLSHSADAYKFRILLQDKGKTEYNINKPQEFLSQRAIDRRKKQNIEINISDLPISEEYIKTIEKYNCRIIAKSKWMETISIQCNDSLEVENIKKLNFIKDIVWVGKSVGIEANLKTRSKPKYPTTRAPNYYGYASDQILTLNGQSLHDKGFKGENMEIAIMDAGYSNLKDILYLDNVFIKGIKDFIYDRDDILSNGNEHGINVLSAMAANQPNTFVGTAPKAKYWLFRSEDDRSEYPIEEDYWVSAIEYADSVGVDLVNTSLGYNIFDFPAKSYTHEQLDGKTSFMSRAAEIATQKGIFVVVSAGNEGAKTWQKITIPADAEHVLTVGSMAKDSIISSFSSKGPTADGRIKPDVVALGEKINLIGSSSDVIVNSGTSFAGPVICGLAACLWQAFPDLSNIELLNIIKSSSSKYNNPGISYGYGIPDMKLAMQLAQDITTGIEEELPIEIQSEFQYESDSIGHIRISKLDKNDDNIYRLRIYSINGRILLNENMNNTSNDFQLNSYSKQPYIINISGYNKNESQKILF